MSIRPSPRLLADLISELSLRPADKDHFFGRYRGHGVVTPALAVRAALLMWSCAGENGAWHVAAGIATVAVAVAVVHGPRRRETITV